MRVATDEEHEIRWPKSTKTNLRLLSRRANQKVDGFWEGTQI